MNQSQHLKWRHLKAPIILLCPVVLAIFDFLLSEKRELAIAQRFFRRSLEAQHSQQPRIVNADKNPVYPSTVMELKKTGELNRRSKLRPIRYLNNLIEQDHRFIKLRVNPMVGFSKFKTTRSTICGIEMTNMIQRGKSLASLRAI